MRAADASEAAGVNDRAQLADAEAVLRRRINGDWMRAGVRMLDPATTYIDITVELAEDVTLGAPVYLEGSTKIGRGAVVGPFSRLVDTTVGPGAQLESTTAVAAVIGPDARVGPYVALEPGAHVGIGKETGGLPRE